MSETNEQKEAPSDGASPIVRIDFPEVLPCDDAADRSTSYEFAALNEPFVIRNYP